MLGLPRSSSLPGTRFRTPLTRVLPETAAGLLAAHLHRLSAHAHPAALEPRPGRTASSSSSSSSSASASGDIAALYIGKRFGRRKLAPTLSPNKTWEGAIASVFASVIFGVGLIALRRLARRPRLQLHSQLHTNAALVAASSSLAVVNVAAQVGDLAESALKRSAGVKDSGTLLPGHGGILDRIDALLLAAPVLWYAHDSTRSLFSELSSSRDLAER